jgi:predicted phosphodiesterase
VIAKGDLTAVGTQEEHAAFLECYRPVFGDRLVEVRGNHDVMSGERFAADSCREVVLEGAILAVLDTSIDGHDTGAISPEQLEWLDELAARADRPVLVFGHHHAADPDTELGNLSFFGIDPECSKALVDVVARRARILAYFAGHTHRNRVRRFSASGDVPYVEVAAAKDFPGSWAEYRVFEGGVLQVHRRTSADEALAWSERCRALYWGMYPRYSFGALADRCFPIWPR